MSLVGRRKMGELDPKRISQSLPQWPMHFLHFQWSCRHFIFLDKFSWQLKFRSRPWGCNLKFSQLLYMQFNSLIACCRGFGVLGLENGVELWNPSTEYLSSFSPQHLLHNKVSLTVVNSPRRCPFVCMAICGLHILYVMPMSFRHLAHSSYTQEILEIIRSAALFVHNLECSFLIVMKIKQESTVIAGLAALQW